MPMSLRMLLSLVLLAGLQLAAGAAEAADRPSRVILNWAGDPARTQAVTWRTDAPVERPMGLVAPWSARPVGGPEGLDSRVTTVTATTEPVELDGRTVYSHSIQIVDLEPDTRYAYKVGGDGAWSEWHGFRTASDGAEPFRFIYLGDAQNDLLAQWSRAVRSAYAAAPDARFLLHAGDLVTRGHDDALWGEWFEALGFIAAGIPSIPAVGNHEFANRENPAGGGTERVLTPLWRSNFTLPLNGPEGADRVAESAFWLDYQGVRIIALDSSQEREAQLPWLEELLRDNPNRWTIVTFHHPIYSTGKGRDNAAWREALVPLFDRYGVDLVLTGHDHGYGRTHKLKAGQPVEMDEPGTIYAVSVSGPKMYVTEPLQSELMAVTRGYTQMFQVIEVDGDRLIYEARAIDGEVVDRFELRGGEGRN